jgi:hypothetical protein
MPRYILHAWRPGCASSYRARAVAGLVALSFCAASPQLHAEVPAAGQLVARYRGTVQRLDDVSFDARGQSYMQGVYLNLTEETLVAEYAWHCLRRDARWNIRQEIAGRGPQEGQAKFQFVTGKTADLYLQDSGEFSVRAWLRAAGAAPNAPESHIEGTLLEASLAYGYMLGTSETTILEVLAASQCTARPQAESIDGHSVWVIDAHGRYGSHTLWLDPGFGALPRRIEVRKTGREPWGDKLVSDARGLTADGHRDENKRLLEARILVDSMKLDRVGDVPVIVGFQHTSTTTWSDGETSSIRSVCSIENVQFSPEPEEGEFEPMREIPDGKRIFVEPGIEYAWRQGEVVKVMDSNAVPDGEDFVFVDPPSHALQTLLVVGGLAFGVVVLGVLYLRRRRIPR